MQKRWVYKLTASLLPFVLLALVELCLRAGGYGYDTRLFTADGDDPRFLVMNRQVSRKYFTINQNATIGNQDVFFREKPQGTLRFFVLGASSALGFPYMHNGSFPRMLKYKLQFAFPRNNIEIINLSLTAINTYTLYDFSKQLIDHDPDGVLIYAGHNEYYGALGVASSGRSGRGGGFVRMMLAAKNLKLVQALSALAEKIAPPERHLTDEDRTLMERMAARQLVHYDTEMYDAGVGQFGDNLERMLRLFRKHDVPVFVSTLACNLKGQAPLDRGSADAVREYRLGEEAYAEQRYAEALEHYTAAKDRDALRFRAPEVFDTIIRRCADEFENVHTVDVRAAFAERSPEGIVGNELLLEHVHPNLAGQWLIAETFCLALSEHLFPAMGLQVSGYDVDLDDYPATISDSIYGDLAIHRLRQQWPFNETPPDPDYDRETVEYETAELFFHRKINWGEAMQRLNNHYIRTGDIAGALRIVEQMCLELPREKPFFRQAGSLAIQLGEKEKADWYFNKARQL